MTFDLSFYWKLFWRRLPVMLLFVLVCSMLGTITALRLPNVWSTSARLLVEAPQISDRMVTDTINVDPIEQLDIIQQRLLTRSNLIDIANRFTVYEDIRTMEPDTVVTRMRQDTTLRRSTGRQSATVLSISFDARNAQIARDVVNEYVTLVLEENSNFRVGRAENTLNFFRQEVERLSEDINRQSARIASFKSENADSLPEDQNFRLNQQTQLQGRLTLLERELVAARNQRDEIERVFELAGQQDGLPPVSERTPEEQQLAQARAQLEEALTIYSEAHPLVVRLNTRIENLTDTVDSQRLNGLDTGDEEAPLSRQEALMQASLAEIDIRIEFIEADIATVQGQLERLQGAIAASSANGIELSRLERDYANIQARYNTAVNNLSRAQMSERIESNAQGQRITTIENASLPQVPAGPNRPQIIAIGIAAGLGLAVAYFALLELLNRSIRRPAELVSRFNVQPIAVVPYMESRRERLLRRGGILAATVAVLVAVPVGLWYIDANYLPLELVVQRGLSRLGLG